jgi:hypothetical protein
MSEKDVPQRKSYKPESAPPTTNVRSLLGAVSLTAVVHRHRTFEQMPDELRHRQTDKPHLADQRLQLHDRHT